MRLTGALTGLTIDLSACRGARRVAVSGGRRVARSRRARAMRISFPRIDAMMPSALRSPPGAGRVAPSRMLLVLRMLLGAFVSALACAPAAALTVEVGGRAVELVRAGADGALVPR